MSSLSQKSRILGGLWGSVVGDALGVPVEFEDRETLQSDPVTNMRWHGTHGQQAGTWSDDSSLLLCTTDSLVEREFDTEDMGERFLAWYREELWTPWGKVFDIGGGTSEALARIAKGVRAEVAGGDSERSNGNGSLMRILPVALRFASAPDERLMDCVSKSSSITHAHPRSIMSCVFYALLVRQLLEGWKPCPGWDTAKVVFSGTYQRHADLCHFDQLLEGDLASKPANEIPSGGYVIHTLLASVWCLLTTHSFEECVLKAVNLGGDTDTTGCVAGGLAGVAYGFDSIPPDWISQIARRSDLDDLFNRFAAKVTGLQ